MSKTKRHVLDGMLAAVYFALSFLIVNVGPVQIRFTSAALIVCALLYGPVDAVVVGFVGELLYQLLVFGVTPTLPVWLVPPVLHALALGLAAKLCGRPPERRVLLCGAGILCASLVNTVANTAALYVDSKVFGYYTPAVIFGALLLRLGLGLATAAALAAACIPVVKVLRKRRVLE